MLASRDAPDDCRNGSFNSGPVLEGIKGGMNDGFDGCCDGFSEAGDIRLSVVTAETADEW